MRLLMLHNRRHRFIFLTVCWFSAFFDASGQPVFQWDKTYGGAGWEELQEIRPLANGDIILGGTTFSDSSGHVSQHPCPSSDPTNGLGKGDFWVVRIDLYGNFLWEKRYGGNRLDRVWDILPTQDNGFLIGGESYSDRSCDKSEDARGGKDYWLIKIDSVGNLEWEKTYGSAGDDELHAMEELSDGSFFVLGFADSLGGGDRTAPVHGSMDFWLLKLDKNGGKIWDKSFGGSRWEQAYSLKKTPEGNYLLGGFSMSEAFTGNKTAPLQGQVHRFNNDFWVIKIDPEGNMIWDRTYGGNEEDVLLDIEPNLDGGFLLCGQSASGVSGNKSAAQKGKHDYWLVKIDANGTKLWDKIFGGHEEDFGFSVHQNSDGFYLVGGVSNSNKGLDKSENSRGGNDFWLLYLDDKGELLWDLTFGGDNIDALTEIFPVADGGIILGGHSSSGVNGDKTQANQGQNDLWVIKTACKLSLDLGQDTLICGREPLYFDARQPNCLDCKYRWSDGSREPKRTILPISTRFYTLNVTSRNGCEIKDSVLVEVHDSPSGIFAQVIPPACPGVEDGSIVIQDVDGGEEPLLFSTNGRYFEDRTEYWKLAAGTYHFYIEDANGCRFDTSILLPEPKPMNLIIQGGGLLELGDSTQLIPLFDDTEIDTFFWDPDPTLSCTDCLYPYAKPFSPNFYHFTIINDKGCKEKKNVFVGLSKERKVYFPTAFSPDGNGHNDFYSIYPDNSVRFIRTFQIYDRWGEMLFEAKNWLPSEGNIGWDGKLQDREMPSGTYIVYAEIEFIDGWVETYEDSFLLMK